MKVAFACFAMVICTGVAADTITLEPSSDDAAALERARDALRGGGEIVLRGGTYRLARSVTFTAEDSGITIRAEENETPVLTGGRVITGWRPFRDNILMTRMPNWRPGDFRPRQLFFRGARQTLARFPDFDPDDPLYGGWAFIKGVLSRTAFAYEPGQFPRRWSKPQQGEIFIFPWFCWVSDIIPIDSACEDCGVIRLVRPAAEPEPRLAAGTHYAAIHQPLTSGNRYYVQNLIEELDQPGEWCFDSDDGTIYFWPPVPPDDLREGDIEIPVTDRLIEIKGTHNITLRGLTFTKTLSMFPPRYLECNAPNSRGFSVYLENTADCTIEDCTFDQVGGDAIRLEYDSIRNVIRRNTITDAGAMGINFNNTDYGGFEFPQWWKIDVLRPLVAERPWARDNQVTDNVITRCGVIDKFGAAIKIHGLNCRDNVIAHNLIHHVPHVGVAITHSFGRNIIEYNHTHHTCLEMADTGAFYSNRVFPFPEVPDLADCTVVRYNLIHDIVGCAAYEGADKPGGSAAGGRIRTPYYTFGIYFDNSGTLTRIVGNIVADATLASVAYPVAVANLNHVTNNILLPSRACHALRIARGKNNLFKRNIVIYREPTVEPQRAWAEYAVKDNDYNVYWHDGRGLSDKLEYKFGQWRDDGDDANSIIADPKLDERYQPAADSPVWKLGFERIPLEKIGPR